ncbi:MAG TPA: hypothetical protein VEH56_03855 [Candidatus Saccharimonadales bacterium]|nr:hypothetical protein [Candidatus Saccharimonadales bacterium]
MSKTKLKEMGSSSRDHTTEAKGRLIEHKAPDANIATLARPLSVEKETRSILMLRRGSLEARSLMNGIPSLAIPDLLSE